MYAPTVFFPKWFVIKPCFILCVVIRSQTLKTSITFRVQFPYISIRCNWIQVAVLSFVSDPTGRIICISAMIICQFWIYLFFYEFLTRSVTINNIWSFLKFSKSFLSSTAATIIRFNHLFRIRTTGFERVTDLWLFSSFITGFWVKSPIPLFQVYTINNNKKNQQAHPEF